MEFGYTPAQRALQQEVQSFIAQEVTPEVEAELEEEGGRSGPKAQAVYDKIKEQIVARQGASSGSAKK